MRVDLTPEEVELVRKSIQHCLATCREGGPAAGCPDCGRLERLLAKLAG
jgi:hypothetical protein